MSIKSAPYYWVECDNCGDLGRYDSEVMAARAYDVAALARWGEFARLNFPEVIV